MAESLFPGEPPVSLDEVRAWLRLGTPADDAVIERLIDAATNICEAFIGGRLIMRAAEEVLPIAFGQVRLRVCPVVGVDAVTLLAGDSETVLQEGDYRMAIAPDGGARMTIAAPGDAKRVRVAYRAGMAGEANGVPEAIRHGIIRMTQHLYLARDGAGIAPPAAIAALWQPWRRVTLGGER
ncbi:MAG: head-tail connector protein [Sphingopyxis sp.]|nr:head-tail connector protein [Sphingopyxis sp.]